jgi:hypothetical protein
MNGAVNRFSSEERRQRWYVGLLVDIMVSENRLNPPLLQTATSVREKSLECVTKVNQKLMREYIKVKIFSQAFFSAAIELS